MLNRESNVLYKRGLLPINKKLQIIYSQITDVNVLGFSHGISQNRLIAYLHSRDISPFGRFIIFLRLIKVISFILRKVN